MRLYSLKRPRGVGGEDGMGMGGFKGEGEKRGERGDM